MKEKADKALCPDDSVVKTLSAMQEMQEMWFWSLGWEDPLEEEMASHSSVLAWRISQTEEPGWLQSMGLQRVGYDWAHTHTIHNWFNSLSRRKGQLFCFCPFSFSSEKPKVVCCLQLESVRDVLSPYSFFLYFFFFLFLSFFLSFFFFTVL